MDKRGQALVEFAIVILLLFILVFGIFQFGWLMYIKNTLNNAQGARCSCGTANPPKWSQTMLIQLTIYCNSVYYVRYLLI
jgi:hypothetical protein